MAAGDSRPALGLMRVVELSTQETTGQDSQVWALRLQTCPVGQMGHTGGVEQMTQPFGLLEGEAADEADAGGGGAGAGADAGGAGTGADGSGVLSGERGTRPCGCSNGGGGWWFRGLSMMMMKMVIWRAKTRVEGGLLVLRVCVCVEVFSRA